MIKMAMKWYQYDHFPIGTLGIGADDTGITDIFLPGTADTASAAEQETPLTAMAAQQLREYFAGTRTRFDLPLHPNGTAFQQLVWSKLCEIPYGESRSYADLAVMIENPKACRAVGMANHRNPILIVIPCHRVLGKDGSLTGYAAGMEMKKALLDLECIPYKERK